ncbi:MAG TPA: hypothetical protein VLQ29_06145 [Candidatus Dormibacteraeota bacterium]|nr:hypothetical protein [Candidatus Dormibacteraeota bacterium]
MQPSNGQLLPQPDHPKPRIHNGTRCPLVIQQRIINSLSNGDSIRAIAHALHVSNNTVVAIRDQEWQQVAARKTRLAAQWEQAATKSVDQLNDHLDTSTLAPNILVPIAGVATDKLLALRGEASLYIQHEHLHHSITKQDLLGFALAKSKTVQAKVIDTPVSAPALTTTTPTTMPIPGSAPAGSGSALHPDSKGKQSKKKVG